MKTNSRYSIIIFMAIMVLVTAFILVYDTTFNKKYTFSYVNANDGQPVNSELIVDTDKLITSTNAYQNNINLIKELYQSSGYNESSFDIDILTMNVSAFKNLETLNLTTSSFGVTSFSGLNEFQFLNLTKVIANDMPYINKSSFTELTNINTLKNLQLAGCELTNSDVAFINNCKNLEYVNLANNKITNFSSLRTSLSKLKLANISLNLMSADAYTNSQDVNYFLTQEINKDKFVVGIQNFKEGIYFSDYNIYFTSYNTIPTNTFMLITKNSIDYNLEENILNRLSEGVYACSLSIANENFENYNCVLSSTIYGVKLIKGDEEIIVNSALDQPSISDISGLSSPSLTVTIEKEKDGIPFDNSLEDIDTSKAGIYKIKYFVYYDGSSAVAFTRTITIYENRKITTEMLPDLNLYRGLLICAGKQVVTNLESIATADSNTLYEQDFYFYDINNPLNAPIIDLNLSNSEIENLAGLNYLNLNKIEFINLNMNKISNLEPLVTHESLNKLTSLHLASNKIVSIQGIDNLTTLEILDLSYNQIEDASPLHDISDPVYLAQRNLKQNLQLCNLNMNNLQVDRSVANNQFLSSKDIGTDITMKCCNQIFILLVQKLENDSHYITESGFYYYNTEANKVVYNNKEQYRFTVKLNLSAVNNTWADGQGQVKVFGTYKISIATENNVSGFQIKITSGNTSNFTRAFKVTTVSLNQVQGNFTLKDKFVYSPDRNPTSAEIFVLSNEKMNIPTVNDLNINSPAKEDLIKVTVDYGIFDFTNQNSYDRNLPLTITYIISAYKQKNVFEEYPTTTNLTVVVNFIKNDEITFEDANLESSMRSILGKKSTDAILQYDTYKLEKIKLEKKEISSLKARDETSKGFCNFNFSNLKSLNLSYNNLTSLETLTRNQSLQDNLLYLNVSFNNLTSASVFQNLSDATFNQHKLVINCFFNNMRENSTNQILKTGVYDNLIFLAGIQGINNINTYFFNTETDVTNAEFSYFDANFDEKTTKITLMDLPQIVKIENLSNSYYISEAGLYQLEFTFKYNIIDNNTIYETISLNRLNVTITNTQVIVGSKAEPEITINVPNTNNKLVIKDNLIEVDFEPNQMIADLVIDAIINTDILTYKFCSANDFIFDYRIFQNGAETSIRLDNRNNLDRFEQQYIIIFKHNTTGATKEFAFTKIIQVVDKEAPKLSMTFPDFIMTEKNSSYMGWRNGLYDEDIQASDNYNNSKDIRIVTSIEYFDGTSYVGRLENRLNVNISVCGIYVITYTAIDRQSNVSEPLQRIVRVYPKKFSLMTVDYEQSMLNTGKTKVSASVFNKGDPALDSNPTFYWFIDGKFATTSKMTLQEEKWITTSTELTLNKSGEHQINVQIGDMLSTEYDIAYRYLEDGIEKQGHYSIYFTSIHTEINLDTIKPYIAEIINSDIFTIDKINVTFYGEKDKFSFTPELVISINNEDGTKTVNTINNVSNETNLTKELEIDLTEYQNVNNISIASFNTTNTFDKGKTCCESFKTFVLFDNNMMIYVIIAIIVLILLIIAISFLVRYIKRKRELKFNEIEYKMIKND